MLNGILDIGTEGFNDKKAGKIRLVNLLGIITTASVLSYMIFYFLISAYAPIVISIPALFLYCTTFVFNYYKKHKTAIFWIFSVYTIHVVVFTLFFFSRYTGFHFYLFALPPISFLLFEYDELKEIIFTCFAAVSLFVFCEFFQTEEAMFMLTGTVNYFLSLSVVVQLLIGLSVIVYLFNRNIRISEEKRERLIEELQGALSEVKKLKGFLPICSSCKKIRDDKGYWNQIELYIEDHSEAEFSHGICPDCARKLYPDIFQK